MNNCHVVVIGASAGGISALTEFVALLSPDMPAAFLVVVHTSPSSPGVLPNMLERAGKLPAAFANDKEDIRPGRIYVARPDFHLLVKKQRLHVAHGPKENGFRPAVDPLFRTAARSLGPRVVGIVLSGGLDDGTDGLRQIKEFGGLAIAQHPEEAMFPSMPTSAIRNVAVDHIARIADIPGILMDHARTPLPRKRQMSTQSEKKDVTDNNGDHALLTGKYAGALSGLTCPECGGALWESQNGHTVRFQCHVGHAYTGDGLLSEVDRDLEQALWTAVRTMEEAAQLRRRMATLA